MGLPWVRLDTQFPTNPKIVQLVAEKKHTAAFAWVCSLAYAGQHGTDGFIPQHCLYLVHATKRDAAALVQAGLWVESPGGWDINGWSDFQVSDEETRLRSKKARESALKRWHPDA